METGGRELEGGGNFTLTLRGRGDEILPPHGACPEFIEGFWLRMTQNAA
ncbi:MAG: hypothetical protein WBC55_05105 [Dehalococcoidia bacterium]